MNPEGTCAKTLSSAQMLLAERGYVVIGIRPGSPTRYRIGEIVEYVCSENLGQPFQITAVTDHSDWIAQAKMIEQRLGYKPVNAYATRGAAYYRASTD